MKGVSFARLGTALLLACLPIPLHAQTISIVSISPNTPDLGTVAAAAVGDTAFLIDPANGAVTKDSGNGARLTAGSTRATVTIRCDGTTKQCRDSSIRVRVSSTGSPAGRAGRLRKFRVASGSATVQTPPASVSDPIEFVLAPLPRAIDQTFYVGAEFSIEGDNSGQDTGAASTQFLVQAAVNPNQPQGGAVGTAVAIVYRSISISKLTDLNFGRIVRPPTGSGIVAVDASGVRSVSGGAVAVSTPTPTAATYSVAGEGGRIVSVAVPASFTMTRVGGAQTLAVTTVRSVAGNLTLSGSLGTAGSAPFAVGGSFPIANTTATGDYTGTFNVVVQYN